VKFTPALIHEVRLLLRAREVAGEDISWVSGSIVEGYGNESSDVDVFVITRRPLAELGLTVERGDHGISGVVSNGVRFDVEFWPLEAVDRLVDRLSAIPLGNAARNNMYALQFWETEFIHRVLVGVPVTNSEGFAWLRSRFDADAFTHFLFDNAVRKVDAVFDDAVGMLRAGQLRSAAIQAREAVGFAVDSLLHSYGDSNDKAKFRFERLARLAPRFPGLHLVADKAWKTESGIPGEEVELESFIEQALRLSSDIVNQATHTVRAHHERNRPTQ
jgi:hypothetical protein